MFIPPGGPAGVQHVTRGPRQHLLLRDRRSDINTNTGTNVPLSRCCAGRTCSGYGSLHTVDVKRSVLTIYAPINLTAPCIIFSGAQFSLRGGMGPGT